MILIQSINQTTAQTSFSPFESLFSWGENMVGTQREGISFIKTYLANRCATSILASIASSAVSTKYPSNDDLGYNLPIAIRHFVATVNDEIELEPIWDTPPPKLSELFEMTTHKVRPTIKNGITVPKPEFSDEEFLW